MLLKNTLVLSSTVIWVHWLTLVTQLWVISNGAIKSLVVYGHYIYGEVFTGVNKYPCVLV